MKKWIFKFFNISKKKNWNYEQSSEILEYLIRDIELKGDLIIENEDKTREAFLRIKNSSVDSISILIEMDSLNQTKFAKIGKYFEEIEKAFFEYSAIEKISKKETQRRIKEVFMKGLGRFTDIEICKQNLTELDDIMKYLERLEARIISRSGDKNVLFHENKINNFEDKMWCIIHRSKSHNTKDCNRTSNKNTKQKIIQHAF
ncbi:hypothetical protein DMUE_2767 [Dictyocoela muelleri]|nr:hypothetical protein DMUE_2767 [Dictyocoela muelleri]